MELTETIKAAGQFAIFGIYAIVFAESGLLIGFFLPGDSLLFTAGFLASQGFINIWALAIGSFIAAVLGDTTGYIFGNRVGPRLFNREDSWLFHKRNLEKAQHFYEKHGKFTIIISRFTPIIRTFAPIVAGIGNMEYKTFISYNLIGGFLWTFSMSFAGYFLGQLIPDVDKYLLPIIAIIIIASLIPPVMHFLKDRKESAK